MIVLCLPAQDAILLLPDPIWEASLSCDLTGHVGTCTVIREARAGQSIKLNAVKVSAPSAVSVCSLLLLFVHCSCVVNGSVHHVKGMKGMDESLPDAIPLID